MDFWHLSQTSIDLLDRLHRPRGMVERLFTGDAGYKVGLIRQIGALGEPGLILELADFLASEKGELSQAANDAIEELLRHVPSARMLDLDVEVRRRESWRYYLPASWWGLKAGDLGRILGDRKSYGSAAMASMHPDGYVREEALKVLAQEFGGRALPFLLVRLNDWVEVIRWAAHQAVTKLMIPADARAFLGCLPLVTLIERCRRDDHRWLLSGIAEMLNRGVCKPVLMEGLNCGDRTIRRTCLRIATMDAEGSGAAILEPLLADADQMIRLWAARGLLAMVRDSEFAKLYACLVADRFAPIRLMAVRAMVDRNPPEIREHLIVAALDRNASVRDYARFHLKKRDPQFDVAELYRCELRAGRDGEVVIRGLGEAGSAQDAGLVMPFLKAARASQRRAAVAAIGMLAPREHREVLVDLIADSAPGVSREPARWLGKIATEVRLEKIRELLGHSAEHVRKNAFHVAMKVPRWDQLPLVLVMLRDSAPRLSMMGRVAVDRWLWNRNRVWTEPSEAQVAAARRELDAQGWRSGELDAELRHWERR